MKNLFIITLVILLCFTFSCQQQAEQKAVEVTSLSDEDVGAIKALYDNYIQAVLSGDWDAFAAVFAEDAIVMPPNEPLIQGREAIKAYQESFPPLTDLSAQIMEIYGQGNLAYARGTYSLKIDIPGAPDPIQDAGKLISIFRKQTDGSWLFAIDIYNSDLPLPSPPEKE